MNLRSIVVTKFKFRIGTFNQTYLFPFLSKCTKIDRIDRHGLNWTELGIKWTEMG